MKIITLFILMFNFFIGFSQNLVLEQYRLSDGKIKRIKTGDKILLSFNQLTEDVINRPSEVFIQIKDTGVTQIFVKARITRITNNSIQFKDRSMSGEREIKLERVTGIRKLSLVKQTLRVIAFGLSVTAFAMAINATQASNIFTFMGYLAGAGIFFELTEDKFLNKYVEKWKIRVVPE